MLEEIMEQANVLERLRQANHAMMTLNRLSIDEEFSRDFGGALEAGNARALGELLAPMGVKEVAIQQVGGRTAVGFNLGVVVCVTVTIQVCKQF